MLPDPIEVEPDWHDMPGKDKILELLDVASQVRLACCIAALVCVVLVRNGAPMGYVPIGGRDAVHVSLRVAEDLKADTVVELHLAAPEGLAGKVVVDFGLVEI